MNGAFRVDLHVHSVYSPDSALSLRTIVEAARAAGLNGFALTDHNSVAGRAGLTEERSRHPDLLLIPGVEVSTADGHLLAYGLEEAPPARRPLPETIDWVRTHGGEPALAHPYRWTHGAGERWVRSAAVGTIETRNGASTARANRAAERAARERGIGSIGGSDAHRPRAIGRACTEFPERLESVEDLLVALRRGEGRAVGSSLGAWGAFAWSVRNGALRAARGFRPI